MLPKNRDSYPFRRPSAQNGSCPRIFLKESGVPRQGANPMRLFVLSCLVLVAACARAPQNEAPAPEGRAPPAPAGAATQPIAPDVAARVAKLARTELKADISALSPAQLTVLENLIAAAREMEPIFERQAWEGNPKLWEEMQGWSGSQAEAAKALYKINKGPWDRLDELKPFIGA